MRKFFGWSTCVIAVVLVSWAPPARAQNCTISTTQYDQLRSRLLGSSGSLTQKYCEANSVNSQVNSCSSVADDMKHNGIDYGVSFGTAVYAPVDGVVREVKPGTSCATGSTCELSTLTIYSSRAAATYVLLHLESILVTKNAEVVMGQKIGTVGKRGVPNSGPHVHFEVRPGDRSAAAPCIDSTINPFQGTPFIWDFNVDNNLEGWAGTNLSALRTSSQILVVDPAGADPYIASPTITADGNVFRHVKLRLASNALDGSGAIYFKTSTSNSYSESKKVTFNVTSFCSLCGNAPYADYEVTMSGNPNWTGVITGIRLDPANNGRANTANDSVGLQYIMLWP